MFERIVPINTDPRDHNLLLILQTARLDKEVDDKKTTELTECDQCGKSYTEVTEEVTEKVIEGVNKLLAAMMQKLLATT
jgi:hypothetical protein